jgi:hypothetical protein
MHILLRLLFILLFSRQRQATLVAALRWVSGTFTVSGNTASLTSAIEFAAAGSNWGTVTHGAIFDAATSGNMLAYGTLSDDKVVETGDVLRIQANQFTITLD